MAASTQSRENAPLNDMSDQHLLLAQEQAAMHAARLGIARWMSGNTMAQLEIAAVLMPTSQVRWHAQAQKDFQAWLASGGFAVDAAATPAARKAPGSDLELRGTQEGHAFAS